MVVLRGARRLYLVVELLMDVRSSHWRGSSVASPAGCQSDEEKRFGISIALHVGVMSPGAQGDRSCLAELHPI